MSLRRYSKAPTLNNGQQQGTSEMYRIINTKVASGAIRTVAYTMQEGDRLDIIAGEKFNDARLWWVIAAASGIGWGLQVPPGTRVEIPVDINAVMRVVF